MSRRSRNITRHPVRHHRDRSGNLDRPGSTDDSAAGDRQGLAARDREVGALDIFRRDRWWPSSRRADIADTCRRPIRAIAVDADHREVDVDGGGAGAVADGQRAGRTTGRNRAGRDRTHRSSRASRTGRPNGSRSHLQARLPGRTSGTGRTRLRDQLPYA